MMGAGVIYSWLPCVQGVVAAGVLIGALVLLFIGVDRRSPAHVRWPMIGLVLWALWMLLAAAAGRHDSPPGIAMTALVAYVLLRYGRQVRGILDGEPWWPPAARRPGRLRWWRWAWLRMSLRIAMLRGRLADWLR